MTALETDVLIVGAGPAGLALAATLQAGGVRHIVVDALDVAQNTSRAAVVHPHTLEMLDDIGAAGPLSAEAIALTRFTVRDRDQPLLSLDFSKLPSAYRHMLMVPQSTTEAVIEARLLELGGDVRRGIRATDIVSDTTGATVRLTGSSGDEVIHARYVVGADGMRSVVRESCGIAFEGAAYSESFILADVVMAWPLGPSEVSLYFSPAGLVVVAPLPDGSYRIVATLDNAPERPDLPDIQALLDQRGPAAISAKVTKLLWSSRFRIYHKLASTYRKGSTLLIGDAAHVHSPAGGQGMNTGIVDAIALGHTLRDVIRQGAPASALDQFAARRRSAAKEVLELAGRLTKIATIQSPAGRRLRNLVLRILDKMPPFKSKLALSLSGLDRKHLATAGDGRGSWPPLTPRPAVASYRDCSSGRV